MSDAPNVPGQCDCCEDKPFGVAFCEDGVLTVFPLTAMPTSGGPWALAWYPDLGAFDWYNLGGGAQPSVMRKTKKPKPPPKPNRRTKGKPAKGES